MDLGARYADERGMVLPIAIDSFTSDYRIWALAVTRLPRESISQTVESVGTAGLR